MEEDEGEESGEENEGDERGDEDESDEGDLPETQHNIEGLGESRLAVCLGPLCMGADPGPASLEEAAGSQQMEEDGLRGDGEGQHWVREEGQGVQAEEGRWQQGGGEEAGTQQGPSSG